MISLWRDTSGPRATGGVTAIWTANQASEINRPFDWSKVRRDFLLHSNNNIWLAADSIGEWREGKGLRGERRVLNSYMGERDETKPEQGVIMTCIVGVLVLPLWFLVKSQSSITAEGWLSYSQHLTVCLTITSVSTATSETCMHCLLVHTASESLTFWEQPEPISFDLPLSVWVSGWTNHPITSRSRFWFSSSHLSLSRQWTYYLLIHCKLL